MKTARIGIFFICVFLIFASCEKTKTDYTGYNDIIWDSPALSWNSSIDEVKEIYPNLNEYSISARLKENENDFSLLLFFPIIFSNKDSIFYEIIEEGLYGEPVQDRDFYFLENKLYKVSVNYGNYNQDELDLLKNNFKKKYGKKFTVDNYEAMDIWGVNIDKKNRIVLYIRDNNVSGLYISPYLSDILSSIWGH